MHYLGKEKLQSLKVWLLARLIMLLVFIGARTPYWNIYSVEGAGTSSPSLTDNFYMGRWWILGGSSRDERPLRECHWQMGVLGWLWFPLDWLIGHVISIRIHWIARPDQDRNLHDHPWPFWSFILMGSYMEHFADTKGADSAYSWERFRGVWRRAGDWYFRSTKSFHRIDEIEPAADSVLNAEVKARLGMWPPGVLTLVIMGPRSQDWGFLCHVDGNGWEKVGYKDYLGVNSKGEMVRRADRGVW